MFIIYEVFYDELILLMVVSLFQSIMRAVICANFFQKMLVIVGQQRLKRPFTAIYYMGAFIVVFTILLFSLSDIYSPISCEYKVYGKQPFKSALNPSCCPLIKLTYAYRLLVLHD